MSREKYWGELRISSVGEAIRELRLGLQIQATDLARDLQIGRTTLHRYESGDLPPAPVLLQFCKLALKRNAPDAITRPLVKEYASAAGLSEYAAALGLLLTLEGADAHRHIARLAKRASELVG